MKSSLIILSIGPTMATSLQPLSQDYVPTGPAGFFDCGIKELLPGRTYQMFGKVLAVRREECAIELPEQIPWDSGLQDMGKWAYVPFSFEEGGHGHQDWATMEAVRALTIWWQDS